MLNFKYIRAALVAAALAALTWSSGASSSLIIGNLEKPSVLSGGVSESVSVSPDTINATSTFYSLRRDLRRCVSPLCGGYFVKRVNMSSTRCANGRFMSECYVAGIDWHGQPETDVAHLLVLGNIVAKRYGQFGNLGELRVSESAKLNSSFSRNIAGVNLEGAGLGENNAPVVNAAMTGSDGVIVTGTDVVVTGPGGKSFELKGTQVYVRKKPESGSMKPCIKTGCSTQVCSDHNVITTCEFRPEYACYQKAACERQRDGNCGFTKTPELTACLARK